MPIRARPQAGRWSGLSLAVAFALFMVPMATFDLFGPPPLVGGVIAGPSVRLPEVGVYRDLVSPPTIEHRRLVFAHGETVDARRDAPIINAFETGRRPPQMGLLLGLGIAYFLMGLMFAAYLRNFGHRGQLLRTQLVLLAAVLLTAAVAKAFLLFTALPVFVFPLGALSLAVARHHDRQVAFATTVVAALVVGSLVPFDLEGALVLLMQGFGAVFMLRRPARDRDLHLMIAGLGGGAIAAAVYTASCFLSEGRLPVEDLSSFGTSGLLASFVGGLFSGGLAIASAPLLSRALGHLSRTHLLELTDLNHPLLRQIATRAPGTWAHSLAMANMAEVAATAIGADALLTRVGAYYHDLGKSVHPEYYIENLAPGEASPHDQLEPDVSAEKIFSHCTTGVDLGRRRGIPESVLDFMHMHHGNGLLEYFFHKNQSQGNPKNLSERDFRYPGVPPQTKETAILAICDAVEAASRTLTAPDERTITNLVQRIVFGKLRLGQLDQSGLTSSDLKNLSNSLVETLKNSFHVRIEYPWQKEERAAAERERRASPPVAIAMPALAVADAGISMDKPRDRPHTPPIALSLPAEAPESALPPTATQRLLVDHRLESADNPRPRGTGKPSATAKRHARR